MFTVEKVTSVVEQHVHRVELRRLMSISQLTAELLAGDNKKRSTFDEQSARDYLHSLVKDTFLTLDEIQDEDVMIFNLADMVDEKHRYSQLMTIKPLESVIPLFMNGHLVTSDVNVIRLSKLYYTTISEIVNASYVYKYISTICVEAVLRITLKVDVEKLIFAAYENYVRTKEEQKENAQ